VPDTLDLNGPWQYGNELLMILPMRRVFLALIFLGSSLTTYPQNKNPNNNFEQEALGLPFLSAKPMDTFKKVPYSRFFIYENTRPTRIYLSELLQNYSAIHGTSLYRRENIGKGLWIYGSFYKTEFAFWITQLLDNAMDAAPSGLIDVDLYADGAGFVVLEITNDGAINYKRLRRLMNKRFRQIMPDGTDLFYQESLWRHPDALSTDEIQMIPDEELPFIHGLSTKGWGQFRGGSGLGLFLIRKEIQKSGGTFHLQSVIQDKKEKTIATLTFRRLLRTSL